MQHKDTTHDNDPAKLAAVWYCNTKDSPTVAMPRVHSCAGFQTQDFHWEGESKCAVSMKGALECASKEFFSEELNSWWALQTPGKPDAFYRTRTSIFTFTQPTQVTEPSDKEYRAVRQPTTTL